ncbi:vascular endothelial growth factor B isoform X7 [Heterocephalus glaber]|uniref:Vascular endothelial growth factor B n=1 Tax=Heterocephalus glaber TaxID=10181 RepID=A0AAX6TJL9_HETGA|nr:vascular endothelial growth factor B isoform X7 [Heterocephalus glaber]
MRVPPARGPRGRHAPPAPPPAPCRDPATGPCPGPGSCPLGPLLTRPAGPQQVPSGQERTGLFSPQAPVSQPDGPGHQKKVVSWIDVYARATCQPREVVVPLTMELMGTVAKQLVPSCMTVQRCGGCCPDDGLECVPTGQHQVRMQVLMIRYPSSQLGEMSLEEHSQCECRPKKRESAMKSDRAATPHHRPQPRSVPGWDPVPGAPSPADITHPTSAPGPSAHAAASAASTLIPGPATADADAIASSVAKGGA